MTYEQFWQVIDEARIATSTVKEIPDEVRVRLGRWNLSDIADFAAGRAVPRPGRSRSRVPGMGMNYQDERNLTEPMAVTVAEQQGRSREGQAERSSMQMRERRNTNEHRGRVRATSWRVTAKSQGQSKQFNAPQTHVVRDRLILIPVSPRNESGDILQRRGYGISGPVVAAPTPSRRGRGRGLVFPARRIG